MVGKIGSINDNVVTRPVGHIFDTVVVARAGDLWGGPWHLTMNAATNGMHHLHAGGGDSFGFTRWDTTTPVSDGWVFWVPEPSN